jgi:hypothetical protein
MIRIALAVVAAVGLTFPVDAQVGPLCQTAAGTGTLVVCHSGRAGGSQVGPLCQNPAGTGTLVVCHSGRAGGSQVGHLCQTPAGTGTLVVCRG